jgi:hypothetical protein
MALKSLLWKVAKTANARLHFAFLSSIQKLCEGHFFGCPWAETRKAMMDDMISVVNEQTQPKRRPLQSATVIIKYPTSPS